MKIFIEICFSMFEFQFRSINRTWMGTRWTSVSFT